MKKIILKKGEGKTQKLIDLSVKTFATIVCKDPNTAMTLRNRAQSQKKDMPTPITYDEFIEKQYYHRGFKGILIDDADNLLRYMAGRLTIVAITMTAEEPNEPKPEDFNGRPDRSARVRF